MELVGTFQTTDLSVKIEVHFWKFWEIPELILDGSICTRCRIKRSIVWSYSDSISITLGKVLKPGPRHLGWAFWWKSEKWWKSWFSSRPGSQNKVFKPGALRCRAMFKILTRRAFSLRVIRGQGGASWHFQINWPFCRLRGSFLKIVRNPWIRFGWGNFSRMTHQKIYRSSLLPSHLKLNWRFPSWRKVVTRSSQGG